VEGGADGNNWLICMLEEVLNTCMELIWLALDEREVDASFWTVLQETSYM
jgi:hypothetical protein